MKFFFFYKLLFFVDFLIFCIIPRLQMKVEYKVQHILFFTWILFLELKLDYSTLWHNIALY